MKRIRFQMTGTIPALGSKTDEDAISFFNSPTGQEMIGEVMAGLEPKIIEIFDEDEEDDAEGENAGMKLKLPIGKHEGDGSKLFLTAYKNIDKDYDFEMFIDVEDEKGCFVRQIAVVRPTYKHVKLKAVPNDGPYELLLDDGTNSDFEAVQMPGRTDEVIPVRESAERGMVPHHSDNAPLDLVMTPSRSGLALCARLTSNPGELYIGLVDLKHNGVWWQNIARFHDGGGALPRVIVDLFSEMTRGYDAHKAYTIR